MKSVLSKLSVKDPGCGGQVVWGAISNSSRENAADTLPRSAAQGKIVTATSPSFEEEPVALTLVRPQSKESKGEDARKKGKMTDLKH